MENRFNFSDFIDRIIDKNSSEMIMAADDECSYVEKISYGIKGCVKNRACGSPQYAMKLKKFLFFMRHGVIPGGADVYDIGSYKRVARKLVESGELNEKIMNIFPK